MQLTSRTLTEKTLEELQYRIEFYQKGLIRKETLYPFSLIKIIPENPDSLLNDTEFRFKYIDKNSFHLRITSNDTVKLNSKFRFGENINIAGGNFIIQLNTNNTKNDKDLKKLYFIVHSNDKLVESFKSRLKVQAVSKNSTAVDLSIEGSNYLMDTEYLNKLIEIFINNSLAKKNLEAIRTISFIDDQLIGISDSLLITEKKLQEFRSKNRVMNLSSQGQAIIDQAMNLENEKARIEVEANYYDYLADYLIKDNTGEVPIAPATIGITDPGLTKLVADLADLQGQLYGKSLGEKNPLRNQLLVRIRNTKEALKETLNGVRRANNLAKNENLSQIRTINAQATALPVTERQLLGIERKFKLNDELYTFLLERRAVAQIQKASNTPDNEIIDPPKAERNPIKPKKAYILLTAFLLGLGLPVVSIFIKDLFNNKIKDEEDIKKLTSIPIFGYIFHSNSKKQIIAVDSPNSYVTESFRTLRSKMHFITKDTRAPLIAVTSSMAEEGKTFCALNIASVYSLSGKKTIIVDFDLRKPTIHNVIGIENNSGVSTWLSGKDNYYEIIKETKYENLYVLPSGPIPPNPSELISLGKTEDLFNKLRENFDNIIVDTSPIGTVSDSLHISEFADSVLFIARQNITVKELFGRSLEELKFSNARNIGIIFTDIRPEGGFYGYEGKVHYMTESRL